MFADDALDPDAVLLIDREVEGSKQLAGIIQGIAGLILTIEFGLGGIALGHMNDLALFYVEGPHRHSE